jgi:hypothetical protein
MLLVFYQDVAYVCNVFQVFFQVFQTHISSVSSIFFFMLQMLYLDVSKVDWALHMICTWKGTGASGLSKGDAGAVGRHPGDEGPRVDTRK